MGKVIKFDKYTNDINRERGKEMDIMLAKIILFFLVEGRTSIYKTKLNKLLFYTQFLFAKEFGCNLLERNFIKDYYGPVLENLDTELHALEKEGLLRVENTGYGTQIHPKVKFKDSAYTEEERRVLEKVLVEFKDCSATRISDISHQESLWKNTQMKHTIPLNRAEELSLNLGE